MKRAIWIVLGILFIILMAFAGFAPIPGQKDEPSPLSEESPGRSPEPARPSGPPHKPGEPVRDK
jgi:hypothetical protein